VNAFRAERIYWRGRKRVKEVEKEAATVKNEGELLLGKS